MDNLLADLTEVMLHESEQFDPVLRRYALPAHEVEDVVKGVRRLKRAMVRVHPSRRYVYRLRRQLVGVDVPQPRGMIARVRYLPPRVQIAAALALLAGAMLLARRRGRLAALRQALETQQTAL
jgi:hypothetical protein